MLKKDKLVSIVVPVYNAEDYLESCVDSLISQTYKNIEIILVNDGSTDHSVEICEKYAKMDSRIKVMHKENGGVSSARNTALKEASGDYVCFVDSDDTTNEDMIRILYDTMISKSADIVICSYQLVSEDGLIENVSVTKDVEFTTREALKDVLLTKTFTGSPWGKLFKTEKVKTLSFDEDIFFGEDMLFVVKAIKNAEKIVFIPLPYYNYNIRENSASTSFFNDKRFSDLISRQRIYGEISQMNDRELTEYAHVSIILADIIMLQQLFYEKSIHKKYCKDIEKSVRNNFSFKFIKILGLKNTIRAISICFSFKLFNILMGIENVLK